MAAPSGGDGFDLPRAVGLGAAAFKAYEEPKPVHSYEDYDVKDTTVLILEKDFLVQAFWGVLEIHLERANNLTAGVPGELLDAPNAFAVVSLVSPSSLQARTLPYKFTSSDVSCDPTWDNDRPPMLFPVREPKNDELRIELYDEAPTTRRTKQGPHPLGTATLRLNELLQAGEGFENKKLLLQVPSAGSGDQVGSGSVQIKCRLRKMVNADADQLERMTTIKTLPMSWDAPMEIGLNVVTWLRRRDFEKVTWGYLKDVVEACGSPAGDLQPVAFIANRRTNTEAWVFRNQKARRVVVAFRGTSEFADWLVDLLVVPTPDSNIRPPSEPGPVDPSKIRVHRGFLDGYNSVRTAVVQLLDEVLRADDRPEQWKVEVTGHSLGGALATLAAYDIAWTKVSRDRREQAGPYIGSVAMVTFGAPRVGNSFFAKDFNAVLPDAWRIHNLNDIVSSVPFTFGFWNFTHVGKDVRVGLPSGKWKVADHEVERWMASKALSSTPISSHLEFRYRDTMLKIVRKWTEGRKAVWPLRN